MSFHLLQSYCDEISDPIVYWTCVIAVATIVNAVVAILMWRATMRSVKLAKQAFSATQRPFIGVSSYTLDQDSTTGDISVRLVFENFGPIPARNFLPDSDFLINGALHPVIKAPFTSSTLFPRVSATFQGSISNANNFCASILNGEARLEVVFNATYQGATEESYKTHERATFAVRAHGFVVTEGDWN
jgi:hypothetical protein